MKFGKNVNLLLRIGTWTNWCSLLELCAGILRQVCHHRLLVDVGISHFIGCDELTNAQPIICKAHRLCGVL